jgi:thiamine biosynthesis lipoprotein
MAVSPSLRGGLSLRARWLLAIAAIVLSAATFYRLVWADLPGPVFEVSGETMGTTFSVKVAEPSLSRSGYSLLASTVRERLAAVTGLLSTWDDESEISRFNRHASTAPFPASLETRRVLAAAREVSAVSGGAFDVTVRPLVQAWGFGDGAKVSGAPSSAELASLRERVGWERVAVSGATLVKSRSEVVCDLSAIAKGYGVDALSEALLNLGHRNHLVEIGGELRSRGFRPDGRPWQVAIEVPEAGTGREIHRIIPLADRAMATSGDYRNYYEQDGQRVSHTIDPRSGRPIRHEVASVTVLHPEAMLADAWATALNVLGPEEGFALAQKQRMAAYFILREKGGTFGTRETAAFAAASREP